MGIKSLYHAIHAAGLSDILQHGPVTDLDQEHFWSFLDNTYFDDVSRWLLNFEMVLIRTSQISEAMIASRTSIYDNEVYLEMTNAAAVPEDSPVAFRASVALMHIYIQVPRLICLVRHASNYPDDSRSLASAVALAESLWTLLPSDLIQRLIQSCVTVVDIPPSPEIADIVPDSYHFSSIENSTVISRYWKLQVVLSGIIQTLYQNHPMECTSSRLPYLSVVEHTDASAATELARCINWAFTICPSLPLVPLRIYTTFQVSLGAWYRIIRRLTADNGTTTPDFEPYLSDRASFDETLLRAKRMENFVAARSNDVHEMWDLPIVNKRFLRSAAIDMAGGPIPEWMPISVKFEDEDGELVMRMQYEIAGPMYDEYLGTDNGIRQVWQRRTKTMSPFQPGSSEQMPGKGFPNGSVDFISVW